jgi:glycosyltransferase involved in cell wall biosynthesis
VNAKHSRPRVLFLAPVEPWCRENGSSVITADMLEGLAHNSSVELLPIFLREPPAGYEKNAPAHDFGAGVQLGLEGLPRWASVARALALQSSPMRVRFANGHAARRVLDVVKARAFTPSIVHVEHLPLVDIGRQIARAFHVPLVYRAHNIEAQLWSRRLGVNGRVGDAIAKYLARTEAAAVRACNLTLCISDVDLAWVRTHAPRAHAEVLPPALQVERYQSARDDYANADPQIAFVGGLEWTPNEVGLRWFVDHVLPAVLQQIPNAKLAVLARGAAQRPWLTEHPAVRILPPEANAPSLFASSKVSLAPLLQGGGVRIKILESLALGCPVVATSIGAEGLEFAALTRTDDPAAFAAACCRHLNEPADADTRARVRAAVNEQHGARVVAQRLVDSWAGVMRQAHLHQLTAQAV